MFQKASIILLFAVLLAVSSSCDGYRKTLKSANNELKYETAVDLYEKGDFNKAIQFFDILRAVYRGTDKGEKITYYSANAYFQNKDYNIAAYYYKQYYQMYPRGEHAEESAFMTAFCNYMQSPRPSLDQTNTYLAISEMQTFIDLYPKSEKVDEANKLMDDLRDKLETKAYNTCKLYYRMEDYQAAIASFENLMDEYPDTDYKEEILYYITMSYYDYAQKSIFKKRNERFEKAIESYNNLLYLYPESDYLKNAKWVNDHARENLSN